MKIISKFKDYYDFVAGHDTDPRKVYLRNGHIVSYQDDVKPKIDYAAFKYSYFLGEVWFCDQLYPYLQDVKNNIFWYDYNQIPTSLLDLLQGQKPTSSSQLYVNRASVEWHFDIDLKKIKSRSGIKKPRFWYSTHMRKYKIKLNTLHGAPVMYSWFEKDMFPEVVINGNLQRVNFSQVKSPQETFTDIYNWIPYHEPTMPSDPTDMSRFENKGFSKKTSFRGK